MAGKKFSIVVSMDDAGGIGKGGVLPWHCPEDVVRFRAMTLPAPAGVKNVVIMGHRSFASLPPKHRPLIGRHTMVVSRSLPVPPSDGLGCVRSLDEAVGACEKLGGRIDRVFVVGGSELFAAALAHPGCAEVIVTRVLGTFDCDAFFPIGWEAGFRHTSSVHMDSRGMMRHACDTYTRLATT